MIRPNSSLKFIITDNFPDGNSECAGFPKFQRTKECQYPGWCLEILGHLIQQTGVNLEYKVMRKGNGLNWGTLAENGTYIDGIQGDIERGRVDSACAFYQMTPNRFNHFDFTIPVTEIKPMFAVRERPVDLMSLLERPFDPYSPIVWILFFIGFVLQLAVRHLIRYSIGYESPRIITFGSGNILHSNGETINELIFSIFYTGLLMNTYPAFILSALLTKNDPFPFQTESDVVRLIARGAYKLVVTSTSSWFVDNLKFSADPFFVDLRAALVKNPMVVATADEAVTLVQRGDHILQMVEDSSVVEKMGAICFVVLFSQGLPRKGAHFILPKGSPWTDFLNQQITRTNSFNEFTYRRYFEDRNRYIPKTCENSWISQATGTGSDLKALNLQSLVGLFLLASFGLLISSFFCIAEIISNLSLRRFRRLAKLSRIVQKKMRY